MGRAEIRRFRRTAEEVTAFLKPKLDGNTRIKIVSHTDADGIASAAILARCLYSYNVPFAVKFGRAPEESDIVALAKEDYDLFVFLDQGSAQVEAINKYLLAKHADVLVIDHHPGPTLESPNFSYLNPHHCGLQGAMDISAAGATFSVVEGIDLRFRSLIGLAIVGALGDRQEPPSGFSGVNDTLVKRAIDLGLVNEGEGLRLIRRSLSPVLECIRSSTRPYMVGLSGSLEACRSLTDALGISHSSLISDLGPDAERGLRDAILARVGEMAASEEFQHSLWGTLYSVATDDLVGPRELREYVAVLDACGNLRKSEIGFAVAVGDVSAQEDALALLSSHQEQMLRIMGWLVARMSSFKSTPTFKYIDFGNAVDSGMVGETLSLAIESGLIPMEQPVLGIVDAAEGHAKISARGNPKLVMKGINLGQAMAKASAEVGGYGGGHDVSAASRIPRERLDEFIVKLDKALSGA